MNCVPRRFSLMLGLLVSVSHAFAQTKTPSIEVGTVTLNLGMARDRVLQQIKRTGYSAWEQPPKDGMLTVIVTKVDVGTSEQQPESLTAKQKVNRVIVSVDNDGELTFRAGLLIGIHRQISSDIQTDRELATLLYGIFRQYQAEGSNRSCILGTEEDSSDLVEGKQIEITCTLPARAYRRITVRWVSVESSENPVKLHVRVFEDLFSQ
jgi:hypothetical protein